MIDAVAALYRRLPLPNGWNTKKTNDFEAPQLPNLSKISENL